MPQAAVQQAGPVGHLEDVSATIISKATPKVAAQPAPAVAGNQAVPEQAVAVLQTTAYDILIARMYNLVKKHHDAVKAIA